jgi:predicted acetyltransferase
VEVDRSVAAFDQGEIVGTSSALSLEVTLPGSATGRAAGIANVGVLPTHRRRGILTRMMRAQLDDVRGRGEPLALLTASEGGIYGRFGFGPATWHATYRVERGAPHRRAEAGPGSVWLVSLDTAAKALPAVFDEARRLRPGDIARPDWWWDDVLADDERSADGTGALFAALHAQPDGLVDGYALYRLEFPQAPGTGEPGEVKVRELCAVSDAAYARLWAYLCAIDLTRGVEAPARPLDEPLRWMLADPTGLRLVACKDHIWARLVDLPRALELRAYSSDGRLVLEVDDPFCPWNAGIWRMEVVGGRAEVSRAPAGEADLRLGASDLAVAYLGGARLTSLRRGGRVEDPRREALALADAMFACDPPPYCASSF